MLWIPWLDTRPRYTLVPRVLGKVILGIYSPSSSVLPYGMEWYHTMYLAKVALV
jgi:hypothetical protein